MSANQVCVPVDSSSSSNGSSSALSLWDYAARSTAWALGEASGNSLAEQIHAALATTPGGLTRTEIRDLFHRNQPAPVLDQVLAEPPTRAVPGASASPRPADPPNVGSLVIRAPRSRSPGRREQRTDH
jgi:hypothetical protein